MTDATATVSIILRGRAQSSTSGCRIEAAEPREAMRQALAKTDYPAAEPVLEWSGTESLAVLDVDYHGSMGRGRSSCDHSSPLARC